MAVHTIRNKAAGIINMSRCLPCVVSKLNFVAGSTKLWGRGANHCIIGQAKNRKCQNQADNHENHRLNIFFHFLLLSLSVSNSQTMVLELLC